MPFVSTASRMMLGLSPFNAGLVGPGVFRAPLVLSRAQTGGVRSSAIAAGGATVNFFGADTPRFNGDFSRLLIEGQSTNRNRNPAAEGAIAGTPGTFPTNWFVNGNGQGLTWNVAGTGFESGLPYLDMRLSGTSSGANFAGLAIDPFAGSGAAPGQSWTSSMYFRRVAGSLTGLTSVDLYQIEWDSGGGFLRQSFASVSSNPSSLLSSFRSLTATAGVSTAFVDMRIYIFPTAGVPIDATFRIAAPQLEQNPFATSSIFPASGATGSSTRGEDSVGASLASLGIAANGACTILWSGVIPAFIAGATHTIACVDDGSLNNRFTMRVDQASGQLQAQRFSGGVSATANAGAVTAGAAIKGGMTIDGAGRAAVSLNGGAVAAVTGGPSSGLTQSRLGKLFDSSAPMWGETLRFQVLPGAVSDANLQAMTGALP